MLFNGPVMKIPNFSVLGSIIALVISILIYKFKSLSYTELVTLITGLEGTVLLACSINFEIPPIGQGFIGKLKWTLLEFPKYGTTPSFSPLRFYFGLLFLSLSFIVGAI